MNIRGSLSALFHRDSRGPLQTDRVGVEGPQRGADPQPNRELQSDRELVVVDVGCRWGFAEAFIGDIGRFHVYGFDPDLEECERLRRRYEGHAVTIVPVGLAGSIGKRKLYVTKEPACSSLLQPDPALTEQYPALHCARHVSSLDVQTTTLDSWARDNGVHTIDYIKLDTQGTELEILTGGVDALKKVRALEVEVEFNPIYLGQPIFSDVDLFLRREGFVLWKLTNQVHYSKQGSADASLGEDLICYDDKHQVHHAMFGGQLYWANAHYVRKCLVDGDQISVAQKLRDIALFQALGMADVVNCLCGSSTKE
jgi:FkbM family methyltransferase